MILPMQRRDFLTLLGGAAVAPALPASAQQPGRMRRVGVLMGGAESDPQQQARVAAFRKGLRDLRWTEGGNIQFDIRYGAGDAARISAQAAELVAMAPDVILVNVAPAARAMKRTTQTIPIVFAGVSDPVGDGLAASLPRPGGNITGFSSADAGLGGKWLQLLNEIAPGVTRAAVLYNPDTAPFALFLPALQAEAASLGITLIRSEVRDAAAIDSAVAARAADPGGGIVVIPDIFMNLNRDLIVASAARHRVPAVYFSRSFADDGGLMAYGPDYVDISRRAASYVDLILKGAKPADLPVQNPVKFEFVLNLKTAQALGLPVPSSIIARADEVIE